MCNKVDCNQGRNCDYGRTSMKSDLISIAVSVGLVAVALFVINFFGL